MNRKKGQGRERREGKERCEVHGLCFGQEGACVRAVNRWDIKVNRSGLDEMG